MSDFYSRCLTCGVDLPRGCSFCTEAHKLRWKAEHDEEARPVVLIDEWPFVTRETIVSGAKRENAVPTGDRAQETERAGVMVGTTSPAALPDSRPHSLHCQCHKCRMPF